jgi:iron complex outermembrane recepter protein
MDSRYHRPHGSSRILLLVSARRTQFHAHPERPGSYSSIVSVVFACGLIWALLFIRPAFAGQKLQQFHIEAGDAALTLNEFSRQSTLQLLFDYNVVRGRKTKAISGDFEAPAALQQMLADTGLVFDFVNDRTLAVTLLNHENAAGSAVAVAPNTSPPAHARSTETQTVTREASGTADPAADTKAPELEEVRITGTNLRGEQPVGDHVTSLDRDDMDTSGAATVQDFLRTLPQVFGGGATEDTRIGQEAQTNSGLGSGINLRGLGARATLVLIDGLPLAPGGSQAEFTDIESIPLSSVERIDVLPDSASALYGAGAVGGVVNFVMRDNFTGAETLARYGSGTASQLEESQFAQTLGKHWDSGNGMLSIEYYRREALPTSARAYATSDLVPFGGGNFSLPYSNPGNLIAGGTTYAIPTGQNGTHLTPGDLVAGTENLQDEYEDSDLLPSQKRLSLYTSGRQEITDRISAFGNVLLSYREAEILSSGVPQEFQVPSTNPFYVSPTGGTAPVTVQYDFLRDLGPQNTHSKVGTADVTAGLELEAGAAWEARLYGSFARDKEDQLTGNLVNVPALYAALADPDPAKAFNPFGDGSFTNPATLAAIRTSNRFLTDSQVRSADFATDGPIAHLPGGPVKLAVGAEQREQLFSSVTATTIVEPGVRDNLSRHITSAFGELTIPLFGKDNGGPGYQRLQVSLATRYEHYSDLGGTATPKLGLAWSPVEVVGVRGTWGKSIRAPTLADLETNQNTVEPLKLADSASPAGATNTLILAGQNSSLTVERATSWTTGLDFVPQARLAGLSLSLTYFDIDFRDRISTPTFNENILNDPSLAELITRNPSASLIAAACASGTYFGGTTADCLQSAPGAILDLRTQNIASVRTRGIDFTANYVQSGGYGNLKLGVEGTYLLEFTQQESPGLPPAQLLDTENNPINLKLRGTISWQRNRFGATTGINFQNHYRDTASVPNRSVSSFTTIDAQLRYQLGPYDGGWFQNTRVELNATNLFNVSPPFLNNQLAGLGYDQENADPYGRQLSLQIRKAW